MFYNLKFTFEIDDLSTVVTKGLKTLWGHPFMTSTKKSGVCPPPSVVIVIVI